VLQVGGPSPSTPADATELELEWDSVGSMDALANLLDGEHARLVLRNVPNRRVAEDVYALELLESVSPPPSCRALRALVAPTAQQIDPETVWRLAEQRGFDVRIGYSASKDAFDVLLDRAGVQRPYRALNWGTDRAPTDKPWTAYATSPLEHERRRAAIQDLREFLRARLPDYMVPSQFVVLDALPLTPNGKVDRAALRAPDEVRSDFGAKFVAPRTVLERTIAQIWQNVLGLEKVGINDNFFDLGGHSLLLVRMHGQLADVLDVELSLTDLFEHTTVSALAKYLTESGRFNTPSPTLDRHTRTPNTPLANGAAPSER
jgi:acyl carrier protein